MKTHKVVGGDKPNQRHGTLYRYNDNLFFDIKEPITLSLDHNRDDRDVDFYCPKHRIRLTKVDIKRNGIGLALGFELICPVCENDSEYSPLRFYNQDIFILKQKALALLDKDIFRDANLVRLDDYYIRELKGFDALPGDENYSIKADVKTDKDGDTIVVIYVGYKGKKDKTQFFVKPEKMGLTHDYKDLDPAKILSKIEITLKDRTIKQEYGSKND